MNKQERAHLSTIIDQANRLMDTPPTVNPVVRDADVVDGLIADITEVLYGRKPKSLTELLKLDGQHDWRNTQCPDYHYNEDGSHWHKCENPKPQGK